MDNPTLLWMVQGLLTALSIVLWASHRDSRQKAEKALGDLAAYKAEVSGKYATRDDVREIADSLTRQLESLGNKLEARWNRIESLLDRKQDKGT